MCGTPPTPNYIPHQTTKVAASKVPPPEIVRGATQLFLLQVHVLYPVVAVDDVVEEPVQPSLVFCELGSRGGEARRGGEGERKADREKGIRGFISLNHGHLYIDIIYSGVGIWWIYI